MFFVLIFRIQKLRESGLLNLIRKRYIPYHEKKIDTKSGDELMIDMNDVFRINTILFYGFVASIIVCIVENIHFTLTKRRPRWGGSLSLQMHR